MSDDQENDVLGDLDADSGFEDFEGGKSSFSTALKSNPMVKVGVVLGAFALIAGGNGGRPAFSNGAADPLDKSSGRRQDHIRERKRFGLVADILHHYKLRFFQRSFCFSHIWQTYEGVGTDDPDRFQRPCFQGIEHFGGR